MGRVFNRITCLFTVLLLDISSSFKGEFYDNKYNDPTWILSRNFRNENDNNKDEPSGSDVKKIDMKMPNVSPQKHDSYFCIAKKMPENDAYIVGYEPHAKMQTAHHMLMFGCDDVDDSGTKGYWDCNEMGGTCKGNVNKILYAWAMDAPALDLPKDVGFHVGGSSRIKYIVLQVHYANVDKFKNFHETDHSGVILHLEANKPKYFAGIYLVAAGGPPIPAKNPEFDMNMACHYSMGPEMHPFAFRVHTHKLGYVVTGYRIRNGKWHLIGKGDPRRPQAFYKVNSKDSLLPGDTLAARCTYDSTKRDRTTYIGATGADEMCNFYMMYWYDPAEGRSTDACTLPNPEISDGDYPKDTNVPLPEEKKMEMKRREMNDEFVAKSARGLTEQENWPESNLEYAGSKVGQISGVAVQTTGDVVIFHRGDRIWDARTFDFDNHLNPELRNSPINEDPVWFLKKETGEVEKTWGKGLFYFPHGITIDHENNMWFTDVGMHQIFKYSQDGKELMKMGEKFVPGNDNKHFCKPTDIAVEKDGSFFVSDGYCNSRIMKFSAAGKLTIVIEDHLLLATPGFPPPPNFLVPHSLSLGHEGKLLFVADREHGRVLTFDSGNGKFRDEYEGFGDKVFAICYSSSQGGLLYVINGQSSQQKLIYGSTFHLKTKKVTQQWQPKTGFSYPHDITCDPSGKAVYVSEITSPGRLWKFQESVMY
ncbi:peptidyl-glycine alpha-amidating monooxygenase-like [Dendronephthya gigantea]|uniref:peptidyl-glycine alpha-amidating monooxygenase-like n=1 Tax=Dendronephthya gigantea TaxID=151771 RepID=UPI00106B1E5F|nr:peptidyl-glycine alpha-amidating monooxygenase-like [Dendronephthya gigantea]XP_028399076.1 peptidyl-glycine alpha-amidating monooxygenase-like [Dendronephthya gigantea]